MTRKKQVIIIKSDSKYCVMGLKTWLKNWKKKGWLNSKKEPVANQGLWKQVDKLNTRIALPNGINVKVEWVRGHNGENGNEKADKLAVDNIGKWRVDKSADTRSLHTRHLSNTKINNRICTRYIFPPFISSIGMRFGAGYFFFINHSRIQLHCHSFVAR